MQLAHIHDREELRDYFGSEVVLANDSDGVGASMVRGTLLDARVIGDEWLSIKLTCREYAMGTLETVDDATWYLSTDGETYALIYPVFSRGEDGALHFSQKTPKGSVARVTPIHFAA